MKEKLTTGKKPDIVINEEGKEKWEIIYFPESLFEVTREQRAALLEEPENGGTERDIKQQEQVK